MFDFRLAALLGRTVQEMLATTTQTEYFGWQRFWRAEPWGPYRDNLHTAILARELRRPQVKPGTQINPDDFMIRPPLARAADRVSGFVRALFAMSKPKTPKTKPPKGKRAP